MLQCPLTDGRRDFRNDERVFGRDLAEAGGGGVRLNLPLALVGRVSRRCGGDGPSDDPDEERFWPILEDLLVLRLCVDRIGIDNVMWAIDYPYQPTAPAVAFLESAPLPAADLERIAHGNAERIFRLPASGL